MSIFSVTSFISSRFSEASLLTRGCATDTSLLEACPICYADTQIRIRRMGVATGKSSLKRLCLQDLVVAGDATRPMALGEYAKLRGLDSYPERGRWT